MEFFADTDLPPPTPSSTRRFPAFLTRPAAAPRLTAADGWAAALSEAQLDSDRTSDTPWRNHTFLAYAKSGVVEAEVVYANYGRPEDFAALRTAGVDVRG